MTEIDYRPPNPRFNEPYSPTPAPPTSSGAEHSAETADNPPTTVSSEGRYFFAILVVLLVVTGIVAWANLAMIRRAMKLQTPLALDIDSGLGSPTILRTTMTWRRPSDGTSASVPLVHLRGDQVPTDRTDAPLNIDIPRAGEEQIAPLPLSISIPSDADPGIYHGKLQLKSTDPSSEPLEFALSVRIPSTCEEWDLLGDWLKAAAGILSLVWGAALYIWPAPRGRMMIRWCDAEQQIRNDDIPLGWTFFGLFAPWRRSKVRIDQVVARRPWGRGLATILPASLVEFVRLGLKAVPFVMNPAQNDAIGIAYNEARLAPKIRRGDLDTKAAPYLSPLLNPDLDWWFVLWPEGDMERVRWLAFRIAPRDR